MCKIDRCKTSYKKEEQVDVRVKPVKWDKSSGYLTVESKRHC